MRIGQGFDVHRFSDDPKRMLWLGLVHLEGETGLVGHSDADVVAHALADALLGAAGLGDLGEHFSDRDARYAGIASREILRVVTDMVTAEGFVVESADLTVIAERPKIAPHRRAMSEALSSAVGAPVSVKATTTEGLGFLGRREGIAALCVALLKEKS